MKAIQMKAIRLTNIRQKSGMLLAALCLALAPLAAQDDTIIPMGDGYSEEADDYYEADYDAGDSDYLADGDAAFAQTELPPVSGYTNEESGYFVAVLDWADLLTDADEQLLLDEMIPLSEWGNAIFCSSNTDRGSSAQDLAATIYEELFGHGASGSIFLVDMYRRRLEIHSDGEVYKTITADYAQSITDNIYRMASSGDYYSCAVEAFRQMNTLLAGGKIRQPMKHASNYLLALTLALLICYVYMERSPKTDDEKAQPKADPVFNGTLAGISVTPGRLTKRIIESSSRGSGGSHHSGGGGGHSGGGGGHGF